MKLSEAMREKMLLSFELFPTKKEKGMANLPGTIEHLMKYRPEYISCTYGAGGGNVGANREVCQMIRNAGTVPVTHFTVIKNTKEGIRQQLEQYLADGVDHMLALRGDIPLGETTTCGDFNYATDLVKFVRDEFGDKFEIRRALTKSHSKPASGSDRKQRLHDLITFILIDSHRILPGTDSLTDMSKKMICDHRTNASSAKSQK